MRSKRSVTWWAFAVLGILVAACGGPGTGTGAASSTPGAAAASAAATAKPAPADVTIQLTFGIRGGLADLAVADQKGYFKDENLNVTFAKGTGSLVVMSSVVDGANVFVFGPATAAAQATSTGIPLISVATYQPETSIGIIARSGVKFTSPKDLEGLKLGLVTGDSFSRIFPPFAKKNNVDLTKVQQISMAASAATTAFLHGDVDAITVSLDNEGVLIAKQMPGQISILRAADWGFPLLGDGVTIRKSLAQAKPDLVKRFLRALQRGYDAAQTTPNLAVDSQLALWAAEMPAKDITAAQIAVTLAADKTGKVAGKPYGYVTAAQWTNTLDLLNGAGALKERLPTEQYFTNDFLPDPLK